jgi:plasmid stabilization system protein ParE
MDRQQIIWTAKGLASLKEILLFYNLQNGNSIYSKKLLVQLKTSIKILEEFPFTGKPTSLKSVRELVLGRNSVFYKLVDENVYILLVWDNRMDAQYLLKKLQ